MLSHTSQYSQLTDAQFAALGRVLIESSNIEYLVDKILVRLLRAPDYPALAVTHQLGYSQRLRTLTILIEMHLKRYQGKFVEASMLDEINSIAKDVDGFRIDRNRCAHYLWCRSNDDTIFGIRFTGKLPDKKRTSRDSVSFTLSELASMASLMHSLVDRLISIIEQLPETEEFW